MKYLGVNGYDEAEVRAALHASIRSLSFKYELLNSSNAHKSWITTSIKGASVENNSLADINRTARFVMQEPAGINWLTDRIRPWFRLKMPDGGWAEWPLGIFLIATTPRRIGPTGVLREVEAYDQNLILLDDKIIDRYTAASGSNVVTTLLALLTGAGVTQVNYTATTETHPVARDWEPGMDKRKISNDMLSMINFRSIWFNGAGYAELHPYVRPDLRQSEYTYNTDPAESMLIPEISQNFDLFKVPNVWKGIVSEADKTVISSTYTNNSPTSPTSTVSRGRTIVDHRSGVEATSQAALDAIVQRWAFEASQVYETVDFQTALMPHHEDADLITLSHPEIGEGIEYVEHTWSMELKAGARMNHSVRRVVTV